MSSPRAVDVLSNRTRPLPCVIVQSARDERIGGRRRRVRAHRTPSPPTSPVTREWGVARRRRSRVVTAERIDAWGCVGPTRTTQMARSAGTPTRRSGGSKSRTGERSVAAFCGLVRGAAGVGGSRLLRVVLRRATMRIAGNSQPMPSGRYLTTAGPCTGTVLGGTSARPVGATSSGRKLDRRFC